jgi:hypothetical protein
MVFNDTVVFHINSSIGPWESRSDTSRTYSLLNETTYNNSTALHIFSAANLYAGAPTRHSSLDSQLHSQGNKLLTNKRVNGIHLHNRSSSYCGM